MFSLLRSILYKSARFFFFSFIFWKDFLTSSLLKSMADAGIMIIFVSLAFSITKVFWPYSALSNIIIREQGLYRFKEKHQFLRRLAFLNIMGFVSWANEFFRTGVNKYEWNSGAQYANWGKTIWLIDIIKRFSGIWWNSVCINATHKICRWHNNIKVRRSTELILASFKKN